MKEVTISDEGFIRLVALNVDNTRTEKVIDYHATWGKIVDALRPLGESVSVEEHNDAVRNVFVSLGFIGVSEHWCDKAYVEIAKLVREDEVKKKGVTSTTAVGAAPLASASPTMNSTVPHPA
jgi:hypothetical protein